MNQKFSPTWTNIQSYLEILQLRFQNTAINQISPKMQDTQNSWLPSTYKSYIYTILQCSKYVTVLCLKKMYTCVCAKLLQPCTTIRHPMDCSLPDSSVHGIFQARILGWVAMPSSRGSSWPRDWTHVSYVSCNWLVGSLPLVPPGK